MAFQLKFGLNFYKTKIDDVQIFHVQILPIIYYHSKQNTFALYIYTSQYLFSILFGTVVMWIIDN